MDDTDPPDELPSSSRRAELAEAATDYVVEHGLIGLSLRPMAAELGTSDRMLLYHFDSKAELVATVLRLSNDRSTSLIRALPTAPSVRDAVLGLWRAMVSPMLERCQRVYVEAAALGLIGQEPYTSVVRDANAAWASAVAERLVAAGMPEDRAARATMLMDAAFMGFQLDLPLDEGDPMLDRAVDDLADAIAAIAGTQPGSA
jgi:AcrR family transcriptional regulator